MYIPSLWAERWGKEVAAIQVGGKTKQLSLDSGAHAETKLHRTGSPHHKEREKSKHLSGTWPPSALPGAMCHITPPAAWGQCSRLKKQKQIKWLWLLLSFRVICYMAIKKLNRNYFYSIHSAYLPHNHHSQETKQLFIWSWFQIWAGLRTDSWTEFGGFTSRTAHSVCWQTGAGCWLETGWWEAALPILLQTVFPMPRVGFSQWKGWVQGKNPVWAFWKDSSHCANTTQASSHHMTKSRINVGLESVSTERVWFTAPTKITPQPWYIQLEKSIKLYT